VYLILRLAEATRSKKQITTTASIVRNGRDDLAIWQERKSAKTQRDTNEQTDDRLHVWDAPGSRTGWYRLSGIERDVEVLFHEKKRVNHHRQYYYTVCARLFSYEKSSRYITMF